jgi:hypothetical protein
MSTWIPSGPPRSAREVAEGLRRAAIVAGSAPSVHNTQPWHWRTRPGALELWADRGRQLRISDPDGRMLTISCGAALHHALVELAVQGLQAIVLPFPDPARPDLLARLTTAGNIPISTATIRVHDAIALRRTDRRPVAATPMDESTMLAIANAARRYGAFLRFLPAGRVAPLASLVATAERLESASDAWRAERDGWLGGAPPWGTGVPDSNIPSRPPGSAVPERDFGRTGTLPIGDRPDSAPDYAVLHGEEDTPTGWLQAGQALSAAWLTANELDVSVMPISSVVEVPTTRRALRELLCTTSWPYLVLRLGLTDPGDRGPLATPRLPAGRTVGRS